MYHKEPKRTVAEHIQQLSCPCLERLQHELGVPLRIALHPERIDPASVHLGPAHILPTTWLLCAPTLRLMRSMCEPTTPGRGRWDLPRCVGESQSLVTEHELAWPLGFTV